MTSTQSSRPKLSCGSDHASIGWRFLPIVAIVAAVSVGCKEAPASKAPTPSALVELRQHLEAAGVEITEIEALKSLRELPGCPSAEFRYRLHLGSGGAFLNVSRFDGAGEAEACREDFRNMALKGGASAWERLRRDVSVHGPWLFLFPPERPGTEARERINRALQSFD